MVAESSLSSRPGSQSPFPVHPGKGVHFFPGQPGSAAGYSECWERFRSELNNCSFLEPHSLVLFLPFKAGSPLPELLSTGHGVGPPLQFGHSLLMTPRLVISFKLLEPRVSLHAILWPGQGSNIALSLVRGQRSLAFQSEKQTWMMCLLPKRKARGSAKKQT